MLTSIEEVQVLLEPHYPTFCVAQCSAQFFSALYPHALVVIPDK